MEFNLGDLVTIDNRLEQYPNYGKYIGMPMLVEYCKKWHCAIVRMNGNPVAVTTQNGFKLLSKAGIIRGI